MALCPKAIEQAVKGVKRLLVGEDEAAEDVLGVGRSIGDQETALGGGMGDGREHLERDVRHRGNLGKVPHLPGHDLR